MAGRDRAWLSSELAGVLRDLGQTRSALIKQKASAWYEGAGLGTTDRREQATHSVAQLSAECADLEMEAEALRVEIAQWDYITVTESRG